MQNVLIVIHLLIAIAMVGIILLQRSEGGALGIGGGGVMTGRAAGNLLTRATAILAGGFFLTSLGLALIANERSRQGSIMDQPPISGAPSAPPSAPATPAAPAAPLSR
jgi:preprotein translocase subunit SecG